jgi:hypothetical protein
MRLRTSSPPPRLSGPLAAALGLTCLLAATESLRAQTPPPVVTLDEAGVTVTGLSPGGSVAVFGACRRSFDYYERRERYLEVLHDDDQDGGVRFDVPEGLPWMSAWVVVDLASGERAAVAPEGWPLEEATFLSPVSASQLVEIQASATELELLWVRPDLEAPSTWTDSVASFEDHAITALPEAFQNAGETRTGGTSFAAGDVLVGIDADNLAVYSARLEE